MKAPGRDYYILRDDFERNPRDYFRNLRNDQHACLVWNFEEVNPPQITTFYFFDVKNYELIKCCWLLLRLVCVWMVHVWHDLGDLMLYKMCCNFCWYLKCSIYVCCYLMRLKFLLVKHFLFIHEWDCMVQLFSMLFLNFFFYLN